MSELIVTEKGVSLKEGEQLVRRFHFKHRWTKWAVVKSGDIVEGDREKSFPVGHYKDLERRCVICNKTEASRLRW